MNTGRYVLSQVIDLVDRKTLSRFAARYGAESRVRHFGCRQQFVSMVFAQLTWREGLRDIADCLNARPQALYHLGFREPVARSTLAEANEQRDWRMWQDLAQTLISKARPLYAGEDLGLDLDHAIYALDSSMIDLSLTLFPWADFRTTKAGIKMHTQIDLRGPIPTCVLIQPARPHDVLWLDELLFEPGAFYLMDRGYMDFARLNRIVQAGAFFVTRAKDNLRFSRLYSRSVDPDSGVCSDQIGRPTLPKARTGFPASLRRIRYFDKENNRHLIFLTNNLAIPALTVATLYRLRWRIELFFRWIKQHLRIKHYYGNTLNAVKTQIWIALCVYLLIAILHKQLHLPGTLYRTIQVLSVHPFEKIPVDQLLMEHHYKNLNDFITNQLPLWNL
ncbi:transposase family protein [Opitutaceae bacterium TAV1]|nr:transposase family protein [Opitutaceae bacterium TAV1]